MNFGKIGIIAAMDVEVSLLKAALKDTKSVKCAGQDIFSGRIGGNEVVLMKCGIGKVSAAAGTQAMIDLFHPDCIINTGCAGGLARGIGIGDVVLSLSTAEWDMDTTPLGDPRGYIFALETVRVDADASLAGAIEKFVPDDINVTKGLVVSGDQFIYTDDQRKTIMTAFPDALCAEMEGAAVSHVCAQNGVPFCIIRSMSDTAEGDSSVDYAQFSAKAAEISAGILISMLS